MNKRRTEPRPCDSHSLCDVQNSDSTPGYALGQGHRQVTFLHLQAAIPAIRAVAASLALATFAITEPAAAAGRTIERQTQQGVVTHTRTIGDIGRVRRSGGGTGATSLPAIALPWSRKHDSSASTANPSGEAAVAARRRIAEEAVAVFESRYVDASSVPWARIRRQLERARLRNDGELESLIRSIMDTAGDAYTRYLPARELEGVRDGIAGAMEGVGLVFSAETRGFRRARRVSVTHVVRGSPAHEAGIMRGDEIVAIDTQRVANMRVDDAAARMAGRETRKGRVLLTIVRRSQGTRELSVVLTRRRFSVPTVNAEFIPLQIDANRNNDGAAVAGAAAAGGVAGAGAGAGAGASLTNIKSAQTQTPAPTPTPMNMPVACYMRVRDFANRTTSQAARTFRSAKLAHNTKVIIIDLRGNAGGLVDQAVSFARLLLPSGSTVVRFIGRNGATSIERTRGGMRAPPVPIVVLVDDRTASASELVAAALAENCRAVVVGTRTFGKGSVQAVVPLSDGAGVAVTVAAYRTPNGRRIEDGVGCRPHWHKPDLPDADDPHPLVHALLGDSFHIQQRRFKWIYARIHRCTPPQMNNANKTNSFPWNIPILSWWLRNR